jgi:hypothetical protein
MTSEGLGDMFQGDSADMCAGKFPLGPPSALAEIINIYLNVANLAIECLFLSKAGKLQSRNLITNFKLSHIIEPT